MSAPSDAAICGVTQTMEIEMLKTPANKRAPTRLYRLGEAKRLTKGGIGPYAELTILNMLTPGG